MALWGYSPREQHECEFYIPHSRAPGWQAYDLVVRAAEPLAIVPAICEAIWRLDGNQAVGTPVELQQLIDRTLRPRRVLSWLLGGFAATALRLAALGVYGVVGYRVAQRTKETAIRVAPRSARRRHRGVACRLTLQIAPLHLAEQEVG